MSPHRLLGPHRIRIVREVPIIVNGNKVDSCDDLVLYERINCRVGVLSQVDENELEQNDKQGETKNNERIIILTPKFPLTKVLIGDIITVPWGTRPNTYSPPNSPAGPVIFIDTPSGRQRLIWNATQNAYVGDTLTITQDLVISGEVEAQLECNLMNSTYPEGYSFHMSTGPRARFKIIKFDTEIDHNGCISFYKALVETENTPGVCLQE